MDIAHTSTQKNTWAGWAFWLLAFGVFSAVFPRDVSFDVAHYQIYNGWAALNDRHAVDMAAAEMHSFLNPAWQVFAWALIDNFPGRVVAFILGVMQGLILPVLYVFTDRLLRTTAAKIPKNIIMAIAVTGFMAEVQFGLFASTRNDAISALGFLFALTCLLPKQGTNVAPTYKSLALASFVVGAVVGMKLTNAVYMVGFAAAVFVIMPDWNSRIRASLWCGLIGFLGIALLGGPWAWHLWQKFGNPVFPMMNGVFNAPFGPEDSFRDIRYLPTGWVQGIFWPFHFLVNGTLINEEGFFDPRFQMTYVSTIVLLVTWAVTRGKKILRPVMAMCAALLVSILAWIFMFSIERYMAAAWMLGPSFLACLICVFWPKALTHTKALVPVIAACTLVIVTTQMGALRRASWNSLWQPYVHTELPSEFDYENAIVLFSGDYPVAFTAPAFPKSTILTHAVVQPWSASALDNYRPNIRQAIWADDRKIYALITDTQSHLTKALGRLQGEEHLYANKKACRDVSTSFDTKGIKWVICPLTRGKTQPN